MPQRWTTARLLAIASGGAMGAGLRWAMSVSWPVGTGFPWTVFLLNCGGSFLLGVVLAEEWGHPRARLLLHDLGGIGFCGGLTTFSTYAVEIVDLLDRRRVALAVVYTVASVAAAIAAVVAGGASLRRARALITPVET